MKKILPYILIFLIFVNIFTPLSLELVNNKINVVKNVASATYSYELKATPTISDKTIHIVAALTDKSATGDYLGDGSSVYIATLQVRATVLNGANEINKTTKNFGNEDRSVTLEITGLNPSTPYKTKLELLEKKTTTTSSSFGGQTVTVPSADSFVTLYTTTIDTPTTTAGSAVVVKQEINATGTSDTLKKPTPSGTMPTCSIMDGSNGFLGCIAQFSYYVLFQPTSYLFALTGMFFDNTFAYSVNDATYRSAFVVEGWGIVRDFCNMFFIFILLYIAFSTILNLGGSKTKEMIISVVLIGIFINFSLFATQVIIDASNIMARVFYNSDAIKITEKGANDVALDTGTVDTTTGVLPLSAALVNKVNPQNLIINASEVNVQTDTRGKGAGATASNTGAAVGAIDPATFILVTILASAINIVGFTVFLTVGLIFVVRVIGLWLAMILVPFVFLSYTVPAMQDLEMVGWKKWWPETLKMAFLAPVFIFFLYLVLKFLDSGLSIAQTDAELHGIKLVLSIVFPFAFIMIFLLKAKDIAKTMAGKMGEAVTKAGSAIGGFALGAATGGAAMAMRGTLGRLAGGVAENTTLQNSATKGGITGFGARMALKSASFGSKASFDVRATKAGTMAGEGLGVNLGKAQVGGYKGFQEKQIEKGVKEAELLKLSPEAALKQDKAALDYKLEYEKALVEHRDKKESKGETFNEEEFRKEYQTGENAAGVIVGEAKPVVLNADMTNKAAIMKRAETKNTAWTADSNIRAGIVSGLKAKGKAENPPLSPLEQSNAERAMQKATDATETANKNIAILDESLEDVAIALGLKNKGEVNRTNIKVHRSNKQAEIAKHEGEIIRNTAIIQKNPTSMAAKAAQIDLVNANIAKKKVEAEINKLGSLFDNKERLEATKVQQSSIINQQSAILVRRKAAEKK